MHKAQFVGCVVDEWTVVRLCCVHSYALETIEVDDLLEDPSPSVLFPVVRGRALGTTATHSPDFRAISCLSLDYAHALIYTFCRKNRIIVGRGVV